MNSPANFDNCKTVMYSQLHGTIHLSPIADNSWNQHPKRGYLTQRETYAFPDT